MKTERRRKLKFGENALYALTYIPVNGKQLDLNASLTLKFCQTKLDLNAPSIFPEPSNQYYSLMKF